MNASRLHELTQRRRLIVAALSTVAAVAVAGVLFGSTAFASGNQVGLSPGAGAPSASGKADVKLKEGVLEGSVRVQHLPSLPYSSGRFFGAWFVRTDTGDKAFLGALIEDDSIIFSSPGDGNLKFTATKFTTGPDAGSRITLGPAGSGEIVVLIENNVNGLTPSPVGPVPGAGVAVSGTL